MQADNPTPSQGGGIGGGILYFRSPSIATEPSAVQAKTSQVLSEPPAALAAVKNAKQSTLFNFIVASRSGSYDDFMRAGHCLFALLIGCIAGYFTRWVRSFGVDSSS